jgi:hypothetical protein
MKNGGKGAFYAIRGERGEKIGEIRGREWGEGLMWQGGEKRRGGGGGGEPFFLGSTGSVCVCRATSI